MMEIKDLWKREITLAYLTVYILLVSLIAVLITACIFSISSIPILVKGVNIVIAFPISLISSGLVLLAKEIDSHLNLKGVMTP